MPVQLPEVQLPLEDGAVGEALPGDVVEDTLDEPLPQPVEDVVNQTPVAPIREEARRVVGGTTGGGGNGGGNGGGGTGQHGQRLRDVHPGRLDRRKRWRVTGRRHAARQHAPRDHGARGHAGPRHAGAAGARTRGRGDGAAAGGRGAAARRERAARSRNETASDEGGNPLTTTVEKLVQVVPRVVWLALGVLLLAAIALGGRTLVERRRARALEAEREQLIREVGLLERALLPEVPEQLGALEASVAYRPSEGPAAGGDFYDAFELPGARVAVLLGDVSGHGPEALERTNVIRTGLHACLEAGMSPREALASIGGRASAESGGRFTTVVVAVHDPVAGTLTYSAAGHPPPIVTGPSAYEPLTVASSPPLGVGARTGMRETSLPLPTGSVVCLFTDGLLEARVADEMFGRERLTAMVAELSPDEDADALLEFVIATADEASDDMAVFMLRPLAGAEVSAPRVETVELEAEELELGLAERFLAACEVPGEDAAIVVEDARATAASTGGALIEVTIDESGAQARVSAAGTLSTPTAA